MNLRKSLISLAFLKIGIPNKKRYRLIHKLLLRLDCTSDIIRLLICAVIQLFSNDSSIQVLKFHVGMRYIFWFVLGFYFATVRRKLERNVIYVVGQ